MHKETVLQDVFLDILCKERVPTSVYLINGIKLQGQIEGFDPEVVTLKSNITQMIYKHAISTIVPAQPIDTQLGDAGFGSVKSS